MNDCLQCLFITADSFSGINRVQKPVLPELLDFREGSMCGLVQNIGAAHDWLTFQDQKNPWLLRLSHLEDLFPYVRELNIESNFCLKG